MIEAGYRPQASFLPVVAAPPALVVDQQKPSKRFMDKQAENDAKNKNAAE
jgi:hypothetical protein